MSTPNNPFLPKNKSYSPLSPASPQNLNPEYMKDIKRGALWTGILFGTYVISRKVYKDLAPPPSWKFLVGTAIAANVASFGIEFGKKEGLVADYV